HTRSYGDWSSDVCSSDLVSTPESVSVESRLESAPESVPESAGVAVSGPASTLAGRHTWSTHVSPPRQSRSIAHSGAHVPPRHTRSEERRVGKEGTAREGA